MLHQERLIMWPSLAVLLLLFVGTSTGITPLTEWQLGSANHFGAPKDHPIDPLNPVVRLGGCSYGEINPTRYPFYNIVAIHPESPLLRGLEAHGCGACFEIQCVDPKSERCVNQREGNSIVVVNAGACSSGCGGTTVNMHTFAFDKIAAIKFGNVQIKIRQVECEPFGTLEINVKDYRVEEGGFLKITVKNIPGEGGLEKLELRGQPNSYANGGWLTFHNEFGAAFELSKLPDPPFDLRLTATVRKAKMQKTLSGIIKVPGFTGEVETDETFPGVNPHPRTTGQSSRLALPTESAVSSEPIAQRPPPTSGITPVLPENGSTVATSSGDKPEVPPEALDNFVILVDDG